MNSDTDLRSRYADLLAGAGEPEDDRLLDTIAILDQLCDAIPSPTDLGKRSPLGLEAREVPSYAGAELRVPSTSGALRISSPLRPVSTGAAVAAVVLIAILTTVIFRSFIANRPGQIVSGQEVLQIKLFSVSMISPSDGWAVGGEDWSAANANGEGEVILYHFTGNTWKRVSVEISDPAEPHAQYPVLRAVSMINSHDGWAVGATTKGQVEAIFLHYNGRDWQRESPVISSGELQHLPSTPPLRVPGFFDAASLQMLSATDGWAASGLSTDDGGPALYHYDGTAWHDEPLPIASASVESITMLSSDDGWAAGRIMPQNDSSTAGAGIIGAIFRYHGGQWHLDTMFPGASFESISMISAEEGWAAGYSEAEDGSQSYQEMPYLVHYANGRWQQAPSPLESARPHASYICTVTIPSASEGWLAASWFDADDQMINQPTTMLLHYAHGYWTNVPLPTVRGRVAIHISAISMLPSGDGWAVGYAWDLPASGQGARSRETNLSTAASPVFLEYHDGAWSASGSP